MSVIVQQLMFIRTALFHHDLFMFFFNIQNIESCSQSCRPQSESPDLKSAAEYIYIYIYIQ